MSGAARSDAGLNLDIQLRSVNRSGTQITGGANMSTSRRSWLTLGIAGGLMGAAALSHWASAQQPAANFGMAVHDPGVRGGTSGPGGPLAGLSPAEIAFFTAAANRFQEIDSVSGTISGENGSGPGPRLNMNR